MNHTIPQGGKINGIWNEIENLCNERDYIAHTFSNQILNDLSPDSYYRIELRAHNAIGYSSPTNLYLKTARGESSSKPIGSFNRVHYQAGLGAANVASSSSPSSSPAFHVFVPPNYISLCAAILCSVMLFRY